MSRDELSPYRYDRAEVRRVLETEGLAEARIRFPDIVVMPIARAMGLTRRYRQSNTWNPAWTALLGTKPDQHLAGELGVPTNTVCSQRRKLGIPGFDRAATQAEKLARSATRLAALSDVDLMCSMSSIRWGTAATSAQIRQERAKRGLTHAHYARRNIVTGRFTLADLRRVCVKAMRAAYPFITLEEMGVALGVTRERVRQYEYEAASTTDCVDAPAAGASR